MTPAVTRIVALGASNLTLGLQTVLSTARSAFGQGIEVLAAPGYGRSYGALSSIVGLRTLPGILQSGLWRELDRLPKARTRGIITDVGNDILYGAPPEQILAWVEEATDRLLAHTGDVVLTELPVENLERLGTPKLLFFRSLFFPPCRLSAREILESVGQVNAGLAQLAATRGLSLLRLKTDWYGFDPIHIRPAAWRSAWREIILGNSVCERTAPFSAIEWAGLQARPPERRWLLGTESVVPQSGRTLPNGGRLWLY